LNYEALLRDNLSDIDRVIAVTARRAGLSAEEADEFQALVHLKLCRDDYAVLRQTQRRHLITFISVVVRRLLLDYRCKSK
jgi:hypothetical protein